MSISIWVIFKSCLMGMLDIYFFDYVVLIMMKPESSFMFFNLIKIIFFSILSFESSLLIFYFISQNPSQFKMDLIFLDYFSDSLIRVPKTIIYT